MRGTDERIETRVASDTNNGANSFEPDFFIGIFQVRSERRDGVSLTFAEFSDA